MKSSLIIFAREPKDGKTKTRLLHHLSVKTVTQLYKDFLKSIFKRVEDVKCHQKYIFYAGTGSSIPFLRQFENQFILKRQMGKGLGERMYRAFLKCSELGADKIIIVGTDCLSLTEKDIQKAFSQLEKHDCVLGPSIDGGYYLIGLKSPQKELFENIPWSTDMVLSCTIKKLEWLNKKYYLLRKQEDIDTMDALLRNKKYITTDINLEKELNG